MRAALLVLAFCLTVALGQDYCARYPTCSECIKNIPCGWCAVNITYDDGTQGPHCAGKPPNPDSPPPDYKPWTCLKDYQNTACYGYICDDKYQCVSSGTPGGGVPLDQCLKQCVPPTYECNTTTYQCEKVEPGHGTDKPDCERQCVAPAPSTPPHPEGPPGPDGPPAPEGNHPQVPGYECVNYECVPSTGGGGVPLPECQSLCAHNITPVFLIGDWRGLEINKGYLKGEWQMKVTKDSAVIVDPNGASYAKGSLVQSGNELWLESEKGTRRGIYGLNELPEVQVLTWGLAALGAAPPSNFDAALQSETAWVWAKCLSADHCSFHIFNSAAKLLPKSLIQQLNKKFDQDLIKRHTSQVDKDPCSVNPDCHSCITAPDSCGWCSVPVIYNNATVGKNCAGTNTTISGKINCTGTFSTVDCTFSTSGATTGATTSTTQASTGGTTSGPTSKYACNPLTFTCEESANGTQPLDVCQAQCINSPVIPPNLKNKYFRGLEIDKAYGQGEWRAHFDNKDGVTIVDPSGKVTNGVVSTTEQYLIVKTTDGSVIATLWQYQPGPATTLLSWAWGAPGGLAPVSFDAAMTAPGEKEFFMVSCLDGKATSVCDFSQ